MYLYFFEFHTACYILEKSMLFWFSFLTGVCFHAVLEIAGHLWNYLCPRAFFECSENQVIFFNTVPAGLQGSSSVLYSVWSIQGNIPILADLTLFAFLSWILVTKKPPEMMLKEGATLKSFLHNWKWKSGMQGSPV